MKIYIFASKDINKLSSEKIKKLKIEKKDKVILCNNPDDPCIKEVLKKNSKNVDFRFLRGHPPQLFNDYTIRLKLDFNHKNTEYYISEADDFELILKRNRLRSKIVHNLRLNNEDNLSNQEQYRKFNVDYKGNKRPSLGFISALTMKKRYPKSEIYLCGFTFQMGKLHDSEFEKNYLLKKCKNIFII